MRNAQRLVEVDAGAGARCPVPSSGVVGTTPGPFAVWSESGRCRGCAGESTGRRGIVSGGRVVDGSPTTPRSPAEARHQTAVVSPCPQLTAGSGVRCLPPPWCLAKGGLGLEDVG